MAEQLTTITAEPREGTGSGAARAVRRTGRIPGILYGGEEGATPISCDLKEIATAAATGRFTSTLHQLKLNGKEHKVLPREVQVDPVTDRPIHVDFMRLRDGQRVRLFVPVRFKNQDQSPGLKRGGVLNIVRHEIEFFCPSDRIPAFIEGDLSGLEINDGLHISAFKLPEGVKPVIQGRDFTVATIVPSSGYAEEMAAVKPTEDEAAAAAAAAPGAAAPGAAPGAAPAAAAPAGGGAKAAPGAAPKAAAAPAKGAPAKGGDKK
jgi:large subunit ribosomal protein L25